VLGNRGGPISRPDEITYADFANPRNYSTPLEGSHCGKLNGVPCGELTQVDEYVSMVGSIGLFLRFAEFAILRGGVAMRYDTDHFLTNERVGRDLDPAGTTDLCDGAACAGKVNARNSFYDRVNDTCPPGQTCDERSKSYDPDTTLPEGASGSSRARPSRSSSAASRLSNAPFPCFVVEPERHAGRDQPPGHRHRFAGRYRPPRRDLGAGA